MATTIINFSDDRDKAKLWAHLRTRRGPHVVEVKRYVKRRTNPQNAYMWGVVLPMAAEAMTEAWGETFDADSAHDYLKREFLSRPVVNRSTGEVVGYRTGSTSDLTTERFTEYLETVRKWCADYFGVEIPSPNQMVTT